MIDKEKLIKRLSRYTLDCHKKIKQKLSSGEFNYQRGRAVAFQDIKDEIKKGEFDV